MSFLTTVERWVSAHSGEALAIALGVALLFLLLLVVLIAQVASLKRRYGFLLRHGDTQDLGQIFAAHADRLAKLDASEADLSAAVQTFRQKSQSFMQGVGVVRFDAFDDVGGEQSYAVAVVDGKDNGVVISSVYTRSDSRTYAKALSAGKPSHTLSREEEQAVALARESRPQEPPG